MASKDKDKDKSESTEIVKKKLEQSLIKQSEAKKLLGREYDFDEQQLLIKQDWCEAQNLAEAAIYKTLIVGKRLSIMKEMEGHGKFADVCKFAGIENTRASHAMRLYRELGETPKPALLEAGQSKLLEVFRLPEDVKNEALETGVLDGDKLASKSVREIRKLAKEYKKKFEKEKDKNEKGQQQYVETKNELEILKKGRADLDDEEAYEEILHCRNLFGSVKFKLTTMPVINLSEGNIIKLKALFEEMRASFTLCEDHLANQDERFRKLSPFNCQMEIDQAEEAEQIMKKHFV